MRIQPLAIISTILTAGVHSTTTTYDDGSQHSLGPDDVVSNMYVTVANGSTLNILSSTSLRGCCNDNDVTSLPKPTVEVDGASTLSVTGDDVSIVGSNTTVDGGGDVIGASAVELFNSSDILLQGTIRMNGGDGSEDCTTGSGGHALVLRSESTAVVEGDVLLKGGCGASSGNALYVVGEGTSAFVHSGVLNGMVLVEDGGSASVHGGLFLEPIVVKGAMSSVTFYGCFQQSESGTTVKAVEVTGSFQDGVESRPINVNLFDGASVVLENDADCEILGDDESAVGNMTDAVDVDDGGNNVTDVDDVGNTTASDAGGYPTLSPTYLTYPPTTSSGSALKGRYLATAFALIFALFGNVLVLL